MPYNRPIGCITLKLQNEYSLTIPSVKVVIGEHVIRLWLQEGSIPADLVVTFLRADTITNEKIGKRFVYQIKNQDCKKKINDFINF